MSAASPGTPDPAYHAGMRELQDRCDTRLLADRLDEKLSRTAFTAEDKAFVESRPMFFLATAGLTRTLRRLGTMPLPW